MIVSRWQNGGNGFRNISRAGWSELVADSDMTPEQTDLCGKRGAEIAAQTI